jgi:hypothetical protein
LLVNPQSLPVGPRAAAGVIWLLLLIAPAGAFAPRRVRRHALALGAAVTGIAAAVLLAGTLVVAPTEPVVLAAGYLLGWGVRHAAARGRLTALLPVAALA